MLRFRSALPAFLAAAATVLAAPPALARPALWKLADADTTIYLFGTIHVLPSGLKWRDKTIDAAMGKAQSLTLEAVLDQDPAAVATVLSTLGKGQGLPPLVERVPPEKRAMLKALMAKTNLPAPFLDGLKSWAAGVVLTSVALGDIGLKPGADGVEPQVTKLFRAANKPVEGLETAASQLAYFDALPESAQRTFLAAVLEDPKDARAEFDRMVKTWMAGDVKGIEQSFAEEPDFTPELRGLLIRKRDELWAAALAERLKTPGTVFVAVGAGHLVGPDSVQQMLASKGLKVIRVQ
ncbi:TraB/GumN family protein [Sphingomonas sp. AP4-R1]|uniref:TraB/GumN family protein n=1 Tax=Sphingomonas sp. AP4-R1 TaxID=2735134 RepID=UPI0014938D36|nr:TraB/GumN family protein [Sphingomonas sp. AP4-R1]QJU59519.1 TraB/GumN family protein [Sphingomonas sp. AP4-R1]